MLRRCAARLALFSSGAGTGARLETAHTPPPPTEAEHSTDKDRAVFLPWTVRPWDVTHHAHRSQWKFLDTVLSHLAKVSPAEMHLRVLEQGARDVLCDLEDPAAALRRQQAQQARQRRRHERAAAATALAAATPAVPASEDARRKPATAAMMAKRKDRFAAATSTVEPLSQRGDDAAYPLDALLSTSLAADAPMEGRQGGGTAAASPSGAAERQTRSAALDSNEVSTESTAVGEDDGGEKRAMARQDEAAPSREKKKLRKRKTSRKAVNVIHYV